MTINLTKTACENQISNQEIKYQIIVSCSKKYTWQNIIINNRMLLKEN